MQHHPLLHRHKLRHELLDLPHGCDAAFGGIVFEMSAFAARKFSQTGGQKIISFVEQERAGVLVENFQQAVHVHEREIVHGQKVARARRMGGPAVRVDIEQWLGGRSGASIFDLHTGLPVELGEFALATVLNEFGNGTGRQLAGTPDEIGGFVIRDDERDGLQPIAAGNRARHQARHDAAAAVLGVTQIRQRMSRDAARGEHERGLFILGERCGFVAALEGERPARDFHAASKTSRAAFAERGQERVLSKFPVGASGVTRLRFHTLIKTA